jgi:hypothetical protein
VPAGCGLVSNGESFLGSWLWVWTVGLAEGTAVAAVDDKVFPIPRESGEKVPTLAEGRLDPGEAGSLNRLLELGGVEEGGGEGGAEAICQFLR